VKSVKYSVPYIFNNDFYLHHAQLLCASYERWTGKKLLPASSPSHPLTEQLFHAPFALVSHGTEADPVFNFGNQTALNLFEMSWEEFTLLPSRKSAEPVNRQERADFMARVTKEGFIKDYSGIRISATGKRFRIEQATVWNLIDKKEQYHGQAPVFDQWMYL
jgi:hypothetical protein